MQPLAYFAVRGLIGWLQFLEREVRAFAVGPLLLVATGAAHCWAVVYALFIAIHTRAMRYDGYHEGYTEHLPFWVSWTETLAVASMVIWWFAGFTTAAIRILDDDAKGLPASSGDVNVNVFFKAIRSPVVHETLAMAHVLSCVGLFVSILLLCLAMALMKGSVTVCELCLCFVAVGFALPHSTVASRRLANAVAEKQKKVDDDFGSAGPLPAAAEAAAQEAASLGPQLCVILALADSPGHAYLWQNVAYLLSAVSFVAAVAACGRSPPKAGGAALPPEVGEFGTCLALDAAAAVALVCCFPHMNTWYLWLMVGILAAIFAGLYYEAWRDIAVDLLDPLLVIRSDADKALPGAQRQRMRRAEWAMALACGAVALWDIMLHPLPPGHFEGGGAASASEDGINSETGQSTLLLRWQQLPEEKVPGGQELLGLAAEAMNIPEARLGAQTVIRDHRLLVFRYTGNEDPSWTIRSTWRAAVLAPRGKLGEVLDSTFAPILNTTLCLRIHAGGATEAAETLDRELVRVAGPATDARDAYRAACDWWTRLLQGATNPSSAGDSDADLAVG